MQLFARTEQQQHRASDPAVSVWVSANAGSGKTHVLAQRVVRLLLRGVPPSKILCLTFTKAAAANMAERVFKTLGDWTRLDDEGLRRAILATGAPEATPATLSLARKLFARTVETPGGLKIQTIHAFCEKLLHLFPFEANVPARFETLEDMHQTELLARARRDVLAEAGAVKSPLRDHLERLAAECSGYAFEALIKEAMGHRAISRARWPRDPEAALRKALDLPRGRTGASIEREMIEDGIAPARWTEIAAFLDKGKKTDQDRAVLFRQAASAYAALRSNSAPGKDCLDIYCTIFFTQKGTPTVSLLTKDLAKAQPDFAAELYAEQARLTALRKTAKAAETFDRTLSLITIVDAIFQLYEKMKSARGLLDFDDLIERTQSLLTRSDARWVLYKLDSGIDHILVDEAQDTSEAQWKILEELTGDFASGESTAKAPRTFFAVGDEKQSIFSFQGAAPHMFHEMRRKFELRFKDGEQSFAHVPLKTSFRSARGILDTVDKVFDCAGHQVGLVAAGDVWMPHEALKEHLPGLVEIWPAVGVVEREDPRDWSLPLDILDAMDPPSLVARRIAQKIALLIAENSGEYVIDSKTGKPRPVRAGDVLILVRSRGPFFEAMIRALKQNKVPVAGADRLDLLQHIAVMDLIAAGRAALLPQDDLTLACVLKSPLIGLDDEDLIHLAPHRPASLYEALAASKEPRHESAIAKLSRWRERAALTPFAFYAQLLGPDGGRRDMEARLGPEAADAIDEFLNLALNHEHEAAPSLVTFLGSLEGLDLSIRRDMETGADVVRVMTVHAAKGLEAKIVFLPDTCTKASGAHDPKIFALDADPSGVAVIAWSPKMALDCAAVEAARLKAREAEADEHRRLLYVALTRAEERLYIAGFHGAKGPGEGSWNKMIEAALAQAGMETHEAFWDRQETILRRVSPGSCVLPADAPSPSANDKAPSLPEWLLRKASFEAQAQPPVRPSSALAAADRPDERALAPLHREALRKGRLVHVLLQYLPDVAAEHRRQAGLAFLAARATEFDEDAREALLDQALGVIAMPALAELFGPLSKAETAICGKVMLPLGQAIAVAGQVDRIGETETEVLVADYKTGMVHAGKDIPENYLTQMALYRAVLAPLWPQKHMRMLLIWTSGPEAVFLDEADLDRALENFPVLARKNPELHGSQEI